MKVIFLGTGTSSGVPMLGCNCNVCSSTDPRDHRLRSSVLIQTDGGKYILIDCGPDFRWQMLNMMSHDKKLRAQYDMCICRHQPFLEGVLITHAHNDHIAGLDDLRPFSVKYPLTLYAEADTYHYLLSRYAYCFTPSKQKTFVPHFNTHLCLPGVELNIADARVTPIRLIHGKVPTLGYRINNMAYITDLKYLPSDQLQYLHNLDILIIDAIHWKKEHPTHQNFDEAFEVISKINAKTTYLIHMSHLAGLHAETEKILPENVYLSYDGLQIEF